MRLLALAQCWRDRGGSVVLAACELAPAIERRFVAEGVIVERLSAGSGTDADLVETIAAANAHCASWIALDGYWFDAGYCDGLVEGGLLVLCVDDGGRADHYNAQLVLNQNLHAQADLYRKVGPSVHLLLGPRYAILRREFCDAALGETDVPAVATRLLVTLGGADPEGVTIKVINAIDLVRVQGLTASIVVGGANPRLHELESACSRSSAKVRICADVEDMASRMQDAHLAVTSGGTTVWELAAMGVPSIVGAVTELEVTLLRGLRRFDLFEGIGWFRDVSETDLARHIEGLTRDERHRASMRDTARSLVDGKGADRVVDEMLSGAA